MSKATPTIDDAPLIVTESRSVELYHFAYGPNMNALQIGRLCSKPKVVAIARLPDHRVGFFGYSAVWDGAQESVVREPGHDVWGVVYKLSPSDNESLDAWQDVRMDGNGNYFHYPARVDGMDGRTYTVLLYKKERLGSPEKPSRPYLDIIVSGAEEKQLPAEYVQELRAIESKAPSYPVPRLRKVAAGILAAHDCSTCSD